MNLTKREMSEAELRRLAPAIFTEAPRKEASDQYLFVPTYKLLEGLANEGFVPVNARQAGVRDEELRGYATHVIELVHKNNIGKNALAEEFPTIMLRNNHKATCALRGDTGIYKKLCGNGLVARANISNSFKIIHHKHFNDEVIEKVIGLYENFDKIQEEIEIYKGITLSNEMKLDLANEVTNEYFDKDLVTLNDLMGNPLQKEIIKRRSMWRDKGDDLWTTLNIIQENIIRGRVKHYKMNKEDQVVRAKTRGINSIDKNRKVNQMIMDKVDQFCKEAGLTPKKEEKEIVLAS